MKRMTNEARRFGLLAGCLAAFACPLFAQAPAAEPAPATPASTTPAPAVKKPPFLAEIEAFEAADKKEAPPQNAVLFIGSSSIRLWKNVAHDFPELKVINRGFGGSQISDSIFYFDRIVAPYHPKTIVFYAGGNDINAKKTPEKVFEDFKEFAGKVHAALPETRLIYVSINPSVARWSQEEKILQANSLIENYIKENDGKNGKLSYIESHSKLLSDTGKPRPEILRADGLHLNDEGYKLWLEILKPQILALVEKDK